MIFAEDMERIFRKRSKSRSDELMRLNEEAIKKQKENGDSTDTPTENTETEKTGEEKPDDYTKETPKRNIPNKVNFKKTITTSENKASIGKLVFFHPKIITVSSEHLQTVA